MALTLAVDEEEARRRVAAARAGDADARRWIAETMAPVAYRYALRMLCDEQDARDAAQDTLVKVLRNLDRYDERWRLATWVIAIARNTCIDLLRRRARRAGGEVPDVADPGPGPAEEAERRIRAERVRAALMRIPPMYREVLVLYHFEHLKYQEIADLLGIPIGTVMNRIFRARRRLRAAYEALSAPEDP